MKNSVLYLLLLLLTSCGLVEINGLSDDYGKLTDKQKELFIPFKKNETLDKNKIYQVTADQLKEEVKNYPKALIYVFTNGCSSELCKPLYFYENWADKNGVKLYLVMNSYANLFETTEQKFEGNLYVINSDFYGKKAFKRYSVFFKNELKGLDKKTKENWEGGLFFYENGNYIKTLRELPNVK